MFDFDLNRDALLATFLAEAGDDLAALEEGLLALEQGNDDAELRSELLRRVHGMKGNASCVGLQALPAFAHVCEDLLERLHAHAVEPDADLVSLLLAAVDTLRRLTAAPDDDRLLPGDEALMARLAAVADNEVQAARASGEGGHGGAVHSTQRSVRVPAERLNRMLDLVGEVAIARGQARALLLGERPDRDAVVEVERHVDQLLSELQELVMRARMVPLGPTFRQYARTVRDLAESHGKRAQLVVAGEDVELDTSSVELLREPLAHLVRNAVDHGIEEPAVRLAAGKDALATLEISARHQGGSIVVRVADDGAGLDRAAIASRGRAMGLDVERLGDAELDRLILANGFSTAEEVTELSGRGVGMDVVRRAVETLRGSIAIESRPGQGTAFTLRLPLTLAMIDGFGVTVGDETFLLPMEVVVECLAFPPSESRERTTGVLLRHDEVVPYVRLRHLLGLGGEPPQRENVVLVQCDGQRAGLVVDGLGGGSQAVIKPLGSYLPEIAGVAGSSILGNGRVALILDPAVLLRDIAAPRNHDLELETV
jgi:two-component system chemotaxis sensor kinase CheA